MSKGTRKPSSTPRQAEEATQADQVRNRAVLAAMPDLMFGYSRGGEILYYNAPDESDLYEEPEEFVGKRIDSVLPADVGATYRDFIQRTLETGQFQQFEYQLPVLKGVQDFECRMVVSGPDEVLAIVRNITERKQAEEKLRASEERFRSITENAADAIFIKDMARRYTLVNPAMEQMLGLPKEDILGKTPEDIFGPEEAKTVKEVDDLAFSGEVVDETRILLLGSEECIFHTLQSPLALGNGEVTSIMGIVRDVTDRKKKEKRDLHDTVCQQLAGLRFLLASFHREISASHPKVADRLVHIEQIAADALTSARQGTEGLEYLSEEPDALFTALRKLASRVSDLYGLQCRFTSRKPVLIGDPQTANHLFLIAREAVSNAVRHAKPNRVAVSLSQRKKRAVLVVRDDGVGFSRKKRGSGMGLDTMRSRAKLIGASFDVRAGEAGGTVVTCSYRPPPEA